MIDVSRYGLLLVLAHMCSAQPMEILRTSKDPAQLEQAAVAVARSRDSKAIGQLETLLGSREFLGRLDDLANPQRKLYHLQRVFAALQSNPSPATERLCLKLADDPEFTAEPVRLNYLLGALAAVRPMSERTAELFRKTNTEGYFTVNGPLLVANGSPRALEVFESMAADGKVDPEERADVILRSIVPCRTSLPVLHAVDRLLGRRLDSVVQVALLQSVFDYRPKEWFGAERNSPRPPAWDTASPEAARFAVELGRKQEARKDLPASVRNAIRDTLKVLSTLPKR
jgi:hypothetical protein